MNTDIDNYVLNLQTAIQDDATIAAYNEAVIIVDSDTDKDVNEIIKEVIKSKRNMILIHGMSMRVMEPMSTTKETHEFSTDIYPCIQYADKWDSLLRKIVPWIGTPRVGKPLTTMISDIINLLNNNKLNDYLNMGGKIIDASNLPENIGNNIHTQQLVHSGKRYE